MDRELDDYGFDTLAIRAGQRRTAEGEHSEPIFPTSSYVFASAAEAGPRLYVSNEFANTVTVIDLDTQKAVATIPVGKRPRGIKASPDRRRVYVALGEENVIAVIDTEKNSVIEKIPAGDDPEAFDLSPDGRFIYVSNEESHTASLIDIAQRKVVGTVKVGIEPEGGAVSPDGKWVYVSSETSHTISVIDAASFKVVATVLVGDRPRGIAFLPDGTRASWRYVASDGADLRCGRALLSLDRLELDLLAFFERLEAAHLDRGVMREQIFAALGGGDEAEALGVVEPLDGSGGHVRHLLVRAVNCGARGCSTATTGGR